MAIVRAVEDEVQQDDGDGACGDAGGEDHADFGWDSGVEALGYAWQHGNCQGYTNDEAAEFGPFDGCQGADTGEGDHAEECDTCAAEDWGWDGCYDAAEFWQETQAEQDNAGCGDDVAGEGAGEGYEADVLSECGVREGVEYTAGEGCEAVGAEAVGEGAAVYLTAGDVAHGNDVCGSFGHDDEAYDAHGDDGGDFEGWEAEHEWLWYTYPCCFLHVGPVVSADELAEDGADYDAAEYCYGLPCCWGEAVDNNDRDQGNEGQDVVPSAEDVLWEVLGNDPACWHFHQGETDDGHDGAGDDCWEVFHHAGEDWCDEQHHDAAGDHGAVDGGDAVFGTNCDHWGERCEGHTHDEWESSAESPYADGADDGGDTGNEQAGHDEVYDVGWLDFACFNHCTTNDEWHGDSAGVHSGDVLEAEEEKAEDWEFFIHWVYAVDGDWWCGGVVDCC